MVVTHIPDHALGMFFSGVSLTVTVLRDCGYTAMSLILDFGGSTELMGTAEPWWKCALY